MEENNKQDMENYPTCGCWGCGMGGMGRRGYRGHFLLRWLLGLLLLALVFCFGVKVGELKSGFGYGRHSKMMRQMPYYGTMPMYNMTSGMMQTTMPTATTTPKK